jgi:surface protein
MFSMFRNASSFNGQIGNWDVTSVAGSPGDWNYNGMRSMFEGASAFNQDISGWTVSSVGNAVAMFKDATSFNQDLSGWTFGFPGPDPTDFSTGATAWTDFTLRPYRNDGIQIDLVANSTFYYPLTNTSSINSSWNNGGNGTVSFIANDGVYITGSLLVDMWRMFENQSTFNDPDIISWDVSNVTNMQSAFTGASAFNQDISGWTTSSVTDMAGMFRDASAFNQDISGWTTSSVLNMRYMFYNASAFNQDISSWDVSKVGTPEDPSDPFSVSFKPDNMFNGATSFNQDLSNWVFGHGSPDPSSFSTGATSWTNTAWRPFMNDGIQIST